MRYCFAFCLTIISVLLSLLPRVEVTDDVNVFDKDWEDAQLNDAFNKKKKYALEQQDEIGAEFFEWIRKHGGYVNPKLRLLSEPDSMGNVKGVVAAEPIGVDEEIAVIPSKVMMCVREQDTECDLAAMLVKEIGLASGSFYWPYLRVIGRHNPVLFGPEEEMLLEGLPPYSFSQVQESFETCGFGENSFLKNALAVLWTRVKVLDRLCLIPFWDSLRHHRRIENVMWESKPEVFMKARSNIAQGEELWDNYDHATPALFAYYGFVENPPAQWFFDAEDGERYTFEVNADTVEVLHPDDGPLVNISTVTQQLAKKFQDLTNQESKFKAAVAAYTGPPEMLELIKKYRAAFIQALDLAEDALRHLLL